MSFKQGSVVCVSSPGPHSCGAKGRSSRKGSKPPSLRAEEVKDDKKAYHKAI
jgi:hypothetical protein